MIIRDACTLFLASSIPQRTPQWDTNSPLVIQPMCGSPSVEAIGMASVLLTPEIILLTGGSGRNGRDTAARVLIKEEGGWKCTCVEVHGDKGDLPRQLIKIKMRTQYLLFVFLSGESLSDFDFCPWWWSHSLRRQIFSTQSVRQCCVGDY